MGDGDEEESESEEEDDKEAFSQTPLQWVQS